MNKNRTGPETSKLHGAAIEQRELTSAEQDELIEDSLAAEREREFWLQHDPKAQEEEDKAMKAEQDRRQSAMIKSALKQYDAEQKKLRKGSSEEEFF